MQTGPNLFWQRSRSERDRHYCAFLTLGNQHQNLAIIGLRSFLQHKA
jgi:hypothetical protein